MKIETGKLGLLALVGTVIAGCGNGDLSDHSLDMDGYQPKITGKRVQSSESLNQKATEIETSISSKLWAEYKQYLTDHKSVTDPSKAVYALALEAAQAKAEANALMLESVGKDKEAKQWRDLSYAEGRAQATMRGAVLELIGREGKSQAGLQSIAAFLDKSGHLDGCEVLKPKALIDTVLDDKHAGIVPSHTSYSGNPVSIDGSLAEKGLDILLIEGLRTLKAEELDSKNGNTLASASRLYKVNLLRSIGAIYGYAAQDSEFARSQLEEIAITATAGIGDGVSNDAGMTLTALGADAADYMISAHKRTGKGHILEGALSLIERGPTAFSIVDESSDPTFYDGSLEVYRQFSMKMINYALTQKAVLSEQLENKGSDYQDAKRPYALDSLSAAVVCFREAIKDKHASPQEVAFLHRAEELITNQVK